jgi:hypothetical protein
MNMEDMRDEFRILVGKPEGERPRSRCEDNIKWILKKQCVRIRTNGGLLWAR